MGDHPHLRTKLNAVSRWFHALAQDHFGRLCHVCLDRTFIEHLHGQACPELRKWLPTCWRCAATGPLFVPIKGEDIYGALGVKRTHAFACPECLPLVIRCLGNTYEFNYEYREAEVDDLRLWDYDLDSFWDWVEAYDHSK
jgi:hypothetical protein